MTTPTTPPVEYVLGFMFNRNTDQVVLIKKRDSHQHAGFWNGVGGKIDPADHDLAGVSGADNAHRIAMAREFLEETGLETMPMAWVKMGTISGQDFLVHVFHKETSYNTMDKVSTVTDEQVMLHRMEHVVLGEWFSVVPSTIPFILALRQKEVLDSIILHVKPHA